MKVVLSAGPAPVPVPDVSAKPFADAVKELKAFHFKVKRGDDMFSPTVKSGDVIGTLPAIGAQAPFASTIVVTVSKGPDLVVIPNVFNLTFDEASTDLGQYGFKTATLGSFKPTDRVQQQTPAAYTKAHRDSTVTISF